jgi:O-acetylserine/cysteine efflux transporter
MTGRRLPLLALALSGVCWGTSALWTKIALGDFDPGTLAVLRFALAGLPLAWIARRRLRAAASLPVALWGAAGYGLVVVLWNIGLTATSVTHAALLVGPVPALVAVVALLLGRGTAGPRAWTGYVVAFAGVVAVAAGGGQASLSGDVLILASAVVSAVFTVRQPGLLAGRDPVAVTAVQLGASAAVMAPLAVVEGLPPAFPGVPGLLAVAALVVTGTILPFTLFAWAQARTAPETAGAFLNLEPVIGTVLGAIAFHDVFGPLQAAGAVAVLGGISLSTLPWGEGLAARPCRGVTAAGTAPGTDSAGTGDGGAARRVGDGYPSRFGLLGDGDGDGEDAVRVGGLDMLEIEAGAQGELPGEGTRGALLGQPLDVLAVRRALRPDRQGPAVDVDVDRVRIGPWQIAAEDIAVTGPVEIHRHRPHGRAHVVRGGQQPIGQPVHVAERVETNNHDNHLLRRSMSLVVWRRSQY